MNVGWSGAELVEVMLLATVYAGFPSALNGVSALREVLQWRAGGEDVGGPEVSASPADTGDRRARGLQALERVSGRAGAAVVEGLRDVVPDLSRFIVEFSYGDVIARPGLDMRTKELATVCMLTALGTAAPQLRVHVHAALAVGATQEQIVEAIQQMAVYAGFPAALNGIAALREVIAQRSAEAQGEANTVPPADP
jgi:4-carboxymuconolactone decarboxylase